MIGQAVELAAMPQKAERFEVVVGNIGTVYSEVLQPEDAEGRAEAASCYDSYVKETGYRSGRASGEPVTLMIDGEPFIEHPAMPFIYVNVYSVTRCYGGPEEGGWWYDAGFPEYSVNCIGNDPEPVLNTLRKLFKKTGNRYSVNGGDDWDVVIENRRAEGYPLRRPHYE